MGALGSAVMVKAVRVDGGNLDTDEKALDCLSPSKKGEKGKASVNFVMHRMKMLKSVFQIRTME